MTCDPVDVRASRTGSEGDLRPEPTPNGMR